MAHLGFATDFVSSDRVVCSDRVGQLRNKAIFHVNRFLLFHILSFEKGMNALHSPFVHPVGGIAHGLLKRPETSVSCSSLQRIAAFGS
jgi:hypothetical protein